MIDANALVTIVFYLSTAIVCALLFKLSIHQKNIDKTISIFGKTVKAKYITYAAIFLIMFAISVGRLIDKSHGGTDAATYMYDYYNIGHIPFDLYSALTLQGEEYIFFNLMHLMNSMGLPYILFMMIIYLIIIVFDIFIIDREIKDEKCWFIAILFFIQFYRSFNIMRNCLAGVFFIITMACWNSDKLKKTKAPLLIIALIAFFNHSLAIVLFPIILVMWLTPEKLYNTKKYAWISVSSLALLSLVSVPIIKAIVANTGYAKYLDIGTLSLWGYVPILFCFLLIMLNYDTVYKLVTKRKHTHYLLLFLISIGALPFMILTNSATRLLIFFELPRYILYSDIISELKNSTSERTKIIIRISLIALSIVWVSFRLYRYLYSYGLTPYCNVWLNFCVGA